MAKVPEAKNILVYAELQGLESPTLMGNLYAERLRGKEIFSFEYAKEWLESAPEFFLDPELHFYSGRQYGADAKPNFGIFLDSAPDRWGRVLMKRREAIVARIENRKEKTLMESDFLLGVIDENRMGALRFKIQEEGDFLNSDPLFATPPWTALRALEQASRQLENEKPGKDAEQLKWLNVLMAPGSSLGGARPKAGVRDAQGHLWIAKFPSRYDGLDVGAWEMVAQVLAKKAGLDTPECSLLPLSGRRHTFLSRRFDRTKTGKRIHFASAMTLLGYKDGDSQENGISYLELAEIISRFGARISQDLEELWRRIVFNICICNTDDHLRNHGFLLGKSGWILSPAYDMNPNPDGTGLALNITETDNALDLEVAKSVASYFRLTNQQSDKILMQVIKAVKKWRLVAKNIGIPANQIEAMKQAFNQTV